MSFAQRLQRGFPAADEDLIFAYVGATEGTTSRRTEPRSLKLLEM